ncbi:hypothetical protein [Myxococcus xanthus]|uniref:hypothetical protein n=1 Tax=Myxococcus xanthus TaxID=34 RepID=UPI0015766883|nr:hypothetical protein [Myxococcus xanthus]
MHPTGIRAATLALAFAALGTAGSAATQERRDGKRGDLNVFLRGGVGDYTGGLGDLTSTGPAWGVTLNIQPTTRGALTAGIRTTYRVLLSEGWADGAVEDTNGGLLDASLTLGARF